MKLTLRNMLALGALFVAPVAQADQDWDQFLAELPDQLPMYAHRIENCLVDTETGDLCAIVQQTFGELSEEGTPAEHAKAAQFLVATMTNILGVYSQSNDWACTEVREVGQLITPVLDVEGEQYAIRASGTSCYLDILDGKYAS